MLRQVKNFFGIVCVFVMMNDSSLAGDTWEWSYSDTITQVWSVGPGGYNAILQREVAPGIWEDKVIVNYSSGTQRWHWAQFPYYGFWVWDYKAHDTGIYIGDGESWRGQVYYDNNLADGFSYTNHVKTVNCTIDFVKFGE